MDRAALDLAQTTVVVLQPRSRHRHRMHNLGGVDLWLFHLEFFEVLMTRLHVANAAGRG